MDLLTIAVQNVGPYQLQNIYLIGMSRNERMGLINLEALLSTAISKLRKKRDGPLKINLRS